MKDGRSESMDVAETWSEFCRRLEAIGLRMLELDDVASPRDRAESIRYLTHELRVNLEAAVDSSDPYYPRLVRSDEPGSGPTAPNVDNTYLRAHISGDATYLLRGDLSSVFDVNISVHRADMAVLAERFKRDLTLTDGYFELVLGDSDGEGDAISLVPDVSVLFIRVYYYDWDHEAPPWFELTCLDTADTPPAPFDAGRLRTGLEAAATRLEALTSVGYPSIMMGWLRENPVNTIAPLRFWNGGQKVRYGGTIWDIGPDQALVVEYPVPHSRYMSTQLYTIPWFEPFDLSHRVTTLNGTQLHVDADDRVRVVLSHRDPGVQNWVDTGGRTSGHFMYRWIWSDDEPIPTSRLVDFEKIREHLPPETPAFSAEQRSEFIARRRAHLARRFRY